MDILSVFRSDARSRRGRMSEIARATGIPLKTISRISNGETPNPRYYTVERLRAFYRRKRKSA